jgi:hypothetical protein
VTFDIGKLVEYPGSVRVDWATVPVLIKRKTYSLREGCWVVGERGRQIGYLPFWFVEEHGLTIINEPGAEYDI